MPITSWRSLQLPPGDRAYWHPPAGSAPGPLLYLAWGARDFGAAPIATTLHDGWIYALVESGSPQLVRETGRTRMAAPTLLLIGPDCASGWADSTHRPSRLLVWMWRHPQHPVLARLDPASCTQVTPCTEDLALLRELNTLTRRETQLEDADSGRMLDGLQLIIETTLGRILQRRPAASERATVKRALRWIEQHLDSHQPLARLADYLALSPSTVQRLFRQQLSKTVIQVVAELRCREAARLITEDGVPVKAVAYRLGYRHPHDFSRAYRRLTGSSPSSLVSKRSPRQT